MKDETQTIQDDTQIPVTDEQVIDDAPSTDKIVDPIVVQESRSNDTGRRTSKRNFRSKAPRREKVKSDFDQKIISLRRVTRVMAGGRRFSFSVALAIGDNRGRVGVGMGKANDTSLAIQKAFNDAKRSLIKLRLDDTNSIPFETDAKSSSGIVNLRPNGGRGLVAGSAVRTVLDLAGIRNVTARVLSRTRNKVNIARATLVALEPFVIARGSSVAPERPVAHVGVDVSNDASIIK